MNRNECLTQGSSKTKPPSATPSLEAKTKPTLQQANSEPREAPEGASRTQDRVPPSSTFIAAVIKSNPAKNYSSAAPTAARRAIVQSVTTKFCTPEPQHSGTSGSAHGHTTAPKAFQLSTPGASAQTPKRKLFAPPTGASGSHLGGAIADPNKAADGFSAQGFGTLPHHTPGSQSEHLAEREASLTDQHGASGALSPANEPLKDLVSHNKPLQEDLTQAGKGPGQVETDTRSAKCLNEPSKAHSPRQLGMTGATQSHVSVQPFSLADHLSSAVEVSTSLRQPAKTGKQESEADLLRQVQDLTQSLRAVSSANGQTSELLQRGPSEQAANESLPSDVTANGQGSMPHNNSIGAFKRGLEKTPAASATFKSVITQSSATQGIKSEASPPHQSLALPAEPSAPSVPVGSHDEANIMHLLEEILRQQPQLRQRLLHSQTDFSGEGLQSPEDRQAQEVYSRHVDQQTVPTVVAQTATECPQADSLVSRSIKSCAPHESRAREARQTPGAPVDESCRSVQDLRAQILNNVASISDAVEACSELQIGQHKSRVSDQQKHGAQNKSKSAQNATLLTDQEPITIQSDLKSDSKIESPSQDLDLNQQVTAQQSAQIQADEGQGTVWNGSLVWKGSLDHIQSWQRRANYHGENPEAFEGANTHFGGQEFKLEGGNLQNRALQKFSMVDRQSLIAQCDAEVAQLQDEFALLESKDFVDLWRRKQMLTQAKTSQNHATVKASIQEEKSAAVLAPTCLPSSEEHKTSSNRPTTPTPFTVRPALPSAAVNTLFQQPSSLSNKSMPPNTLLTLSASQIGVPQSTVAFNESPQSHKPNLLQSQSHQQQEQGRSQVKHTAKGFTSQQANTLMEGYDPQRVVDSEGTSDGLVSPNPKSQTSQQYSEATAELVARKRSRAQHREYLQDWTDLVMSQAVSMLKREEASSSCVTGGRNHSLQGGGLALPSVPSGSAMLVFDKNVDYAARAQEHIQMLKSMETLYEHQMKDYLGTLKEVVNSQTQLRSQIASNEAKLLQQKRREKLSRKELRTYMSLHHTTVHRDQQATANPIATLAPLNRCSQIESQSQFENPEQQQLQSQATVLQGRHQLQTSQSLKIPAAQTSTNVGAPETLEVVPLHGKFPAQSTLQAVQAQPIEKVVPESAAAALMGITFGSFTEQRRAMPRSTSHATLSEVVASTNQACSIFAQSGQQAQAHAHAPGAAVSISSLSATSSVRYQQQEPSQVALVGTGGVHENSGPASGQQMRLRKNRRMANQIKKEYYCFHCDRSYGSVAATVMHLRQKHGEGTKQQIESKYGAGINELLKRRGAPSSVYNPGAPRASGGGNTSLNIHENESVTESQLEGASRGSSQHHHGAAQGFGLGVPPIVSPSQLQARMVMAAQAQSQHSRSAAQVTVQVRDQQ